MENKTAPSGDELRELSEHIKATLAGLAGTFPSVSPSVIKGIAQESLWTIERLEKQLAAQTAELERLRAALYQAHVDLGAVGGLTEQECSCCWCARYRAALGGGEGES